ncbi:MAG: transglycosylase domain-containing protein [Ktedonobacteraceae bacterium]
MSAADTPEQGNEAAADTSAVPAHAEEEQSATVPAASPPPPTRPDAGEAFDEEEYAFEIPSIDDPDAPPTDIADIVLADLNEAPVSASGAMPSAIVSSADSDPSPTAPDLRVVPRTALPTAAPTSAMVPARPIPAMMVQSLSAPRRLASREERLRLYKKQRLYITRKHLRRARLVDRRARIRFWTAISSVVLTFLVLFLSTGTAGTIVAYNFYTQTQVKYENQVLTLRDLLPPDNLKIFDRKGVMLAQMTDQGLHTEVPYAQIAVPVLQATVATEDKNFWTNQGIDVLRIARAALDDVSRGHVVEGGSTITQQLIKNLVVGNESSVVRKLEEIILAPQVNGHYTKSDILEMYLNSIYYGHQAYGIDAAATVYFGLVDKPGQSAASQLDLAQSAMLAGIPSSPGLFDPLSSLPDPRAAASGRMKVVLDAMVNQGYITRVQEIDALNEAQGPHFFKSAPTLKNRAPHFVNFVLNDLQKLLRRSRQELSRSGLLVYTTLDIGLQDKIQKIAQRHVAELRGHRVTNAAEVLIDFHTGAIISLLGSIDYNNTAIDGQFDVATQGYRQPGSSFKPYVYVTAFEQGASPAQAIDDQPISISVPGSSDPVFQPKNYDRRYHGHMTLRCALQNSLNVPAVKVLQHAGITASMQTAHDMGITSYTGTPGYSLVLGGLGVRLIDHTSGIGTFANGGTHVGYYDISKLVYATTGQVFYQHQSAPAHQVISPQMAYMMTSVLSDNNSRIPEFADCNVLQLYSNSQDSCYAGNRGAIRPAAVKTGTTEDFRDNWTVGYTTDYVMGVWAGNDNNAPMINVTGVQGAAPIWHDSMLLAEKGRPIRDFKNPGGLQQASVTYPDGVKTTDWFAPGTVPSFVLPTSTPDTGHNPTPIPTGTPPVDPTPPSLPHPYCPSSYSFVFAPPTTDQPADNGWW